MVKISGPSDDVCEGKSFNYYADDYDSGMELRWRLDAPNSFETYFGIPDQILVNWKEEGTYELWVQVLDPSFSYMQVESASMEVQVFRTPNPMIAGPVNPVKGSVQRYGTPYRSIYDEITGSQFTWTVNGGTIVQDWGNIIEVEWGTSDTGNSVEVEESNPGCGFKSASKIINLEPEPTNYSEKQQQLIEARNTRENVKLDYYHARETAAVKRVEKQNMDRKFKKDSDDTEYLSTKDTLKILQDEAEYHRLNYRFHDLATEQLYKQFVNHGTGNHTDLVENLDDSYPILFFPVNLETKFKNDIDGNNNYHLYLRIYPDDVVIDNHEELITKREKEAGDIYWQKVNESGASESDKIAAWRAIAGKLGSERAAWVVKETNPETGYEPDLKLTSWSQPPRAKVLPDKFVITIYRFSTDTDVDAYEKYGEIETVRVNDQLMTGFDPKDENAFTTDSDGQDLILGEDFDWLEDFDKAVSEGMALKINMNNDLDDPLSNSEIENSKFRIVVAGVKLSADKNEGKKQLENLIDSHHYSNDGMSLLEIDTATSNSNKKDADFVSMDDHHEKSYAIERKSPLFTPVNNFEDKKDGQILADALGIDYDKLQHIENAGNTDIQRALKMNNAVWSATHGQRAREIGGGPTAGLDPMTQEDIDKAREFFTKNVAGRGILPSIRIDDQPYGILPSTVFSQWEWESDDPEKPFQTELTQSVQTIDAEFDNMTDHVIHYNTSGDTQENFLRTLGQQPVSPDFKHTFALGPNQIWNALSYQNQITKANDWYNQLKNNANSTFDGLGFNSNNLPRVMELSFMPESGDLVTPIVQQPKLSNEQPVVPIKGSEDNFLGWLGKSTINQIRNNDLSSIGAAADAELPDSLMFKISREAMILEYWTAAMKLRENRNEENFAPEDWQHPEFTGISEALPGNDPSPVINSEGNIQTEDGRNVTTNEGTQVTIGEQVEGGTNVITEGGLNVETEDGANVFVDGNNFVVDSNGRNIQTDGAGNVRAGSEGGLAVIVPENDTHLIAEPNGIDSHESIITDGHSYAHTLDMIVPSVSEEKSLGEFIDHAIANEYDLQDWPEIKDVQEVKNNFQELAEMPSAAIELIFREHLDLNMHRKDAWQLGMVNRRLQKIRNTGSSGDRVKGIYLGAFGWVEDLEVKGDREYIDASKVDGIPEDMEAFYGGGHIHAPSKDHATTAAVLKSVYEGKKQEGTDTDAAPSHINLSSERVRTALHYIQGMNKGQELGALLGYDFERNLKEAYPNLDLAQYIYVFREEYPLSKQNTPTNGTSKAIKARDVVDGWQLYNELRGEGSDNKSYPYDLDGTDGLPSDPDSDEGKAIEDELDKLVDKVDAINDLLLAESTHQLFQNNQEVAGSIIEAMSLGKNLPSDFDVLKTLRSGKNLTQRFALHLDTQNDTGSGWSVDITERANAEMNLNGWLADKLGDPAQVLCQVTYQADTDTDDTLEIDETVNFSLEDLNLQPIDLLFVFPDELSNEESELTNRIHYVVKTTYNLPYYTDIQVDFNNYLDEDSNLPAGDIKTFEEVFPLIQYLQKIVTGHRYLKPSDYVIPEEGVQPEDPANTGFDRSELDNRVQGAKTAMQNIKNELDNLVDTYENDTGTDTDTDYVIESSEEADIDKLRNQLLKASEFGLKGAIPFTYANEYSNEALDHFINKAKFISKTLQERLQEANELLEKSNFTIESTDDEEKAVDWLYQAAKSLFGKPFTVIPLFKFYNESEVTNAYDNSSNILPNNRPFVVAEVVQGITKVRQSVEDLDLANTLSSVLGNEEDQYIPLQLPHEKDDFWYACDFDENQAIKQDKLGFIMQVPNNTSNYDITDWQGGLFIDEWVEQIPGSYETTGVAYHHNDPDAQAPNSLIFGVTPKLTGNWEWREINEMLIESFKLAKKRAVDADVLKDSELSSILNSYAGVLNEDTATTASSSYSNSNV